MFENVDGRTEEGWLTDAGVIGILIAHLGAFGSGELKTGKPELKNRERKYTSKAVKIICADHPEQQHR